MRDKDVIAISESTSLVKATARRCAWSISSAVESGASGS